MAPKPCVSQHFCDFGQNDGNEEIPCPKRGAEQAFWHAARRKNLVSKSLCFTDVLEQKKLVFVEKRPLAPKAGPRVYPQQPIGTTQSMKEKNKNMFRKKEYFSKAKDFFRERSGGIR